MQEADGTATELTVVQGKNDWNVEGLEYGFSQFDWSAAAEEDWDALADDLKLSLYVPGEISFSCTQNGDIVKITTPQETVYLRAVNPEPEADVFLSNLYSLLDMVPESPSLSLAPMYWDTLMVAPVETPTNKTISRFIIGPALPTAARALSPTYWPTTILSTVL